MRRIFCVACISRERDFAVHIRGVFAQKEIQNIIRMASRDSRYFHALWHLDELALSSGGSQATAGFPTRDAINRLVDVAHDFEDPSLFHNPPISSNGYGLPVSESTAAGADGSQAGQGLGGRGEMFLGGVGFASSNHADGVHSTMANGWREFGLPQLPE